MPREEANSPKKEPEEVDKGASAVPVTWHAATFVTIREVQVNNVVGKDNKLKWNQALLDNQADVSIMHPPLLTDV